MDYTWENLLPREFEIIACNFAEDMFPDYEWKLTGTRITFTTESTIAQKDTSTQAPARMYTRNGVITGAARVETMVIPTESATSPPAI